MTRVRVSVANCLCNWLWCHLWCFLWDLADGVRLSIDFLVLWCRNDNLVWKWGVWSELASRVECSHNLDLDANNSLTEEDVPAGAVYVVPGWLTGVNHESIDELHGLGTLGTQLTGDDDFATLCAVLNDETDDTVACTSHGKSSEELVSEGFALGNGRETTVGDLFGVELNGVLVEVESLLDERGKLTDTSTLFAEHVLCSGGKDDDLGSGWGDSHLNARVAIFGELSHEHLVQFSLEHAVCAELSFLAHLSGHDETGWGGGEER